MYFLRDSVISQFKYFANLPTGELKGAGITPLIKVATVKALKARSKIRRIVTSKMAVTMAMIVTLLSINYFYRIVCPSGKLNDNVIHNTTASNVAMIADATTAIPQHAAHQDDVFEIWLCRHTVSSEQTPLLVKNFSVNLSKLAYFVVTVLTSDKEKTDFITVTKHNKSVLDTSKKYVLIFHPTTVILS